MISRCRLEDANAGTVEPIIEMTLGQGKNLRKKFKTLKL